MYKNYDSDNDYSHNELKLIQIQEADESEAEHFDNICKLYDHLMEFCKNTNTLILDECQFGDFMDLLEFKYEFSQTKKDRLQRERIKRLFNIFNK